MIRVLVVDDSLTVRQRLIEILTREPDLEVVGEAADGHRAVELTKRLRPSVITLDLVLPDMNGIAATEQIMAHAPTPILIVSGSSNRGALFDTFHALAAGAVDVLDKPGDHDDTSWDERFVAAVRMVSRIRVITHVRARLHPIRSTSPTLAPPAPPGAPNPGDPPASVELIALGASTGGPSALVDVLGALPRNLKVTVLVVLHIGAAFSRSFADWLGAATSRTVRIAQDRDPVGGPPGHVLFAPAGHHLVVDGGLVRLSAEPPRNHCQPSIDVLLESIALGYGASSAAALLTGMGCDGAAGLLAIRRAGGFTIAQDEATSIVYGMPREAAAIGAADRILPLDEIGPALALRAARTERGR